MEGLHARIPVSRWESPDWCGLSAEAQWLYMAGESQREFTQCGLLPLRESRWCGLSAYSDIDVIIAARKLLADTGFWVVDEITEEVLYPRLLAERAVHRNPSMLKAACMAARSARGPAIREALVAVLERLPQGHIQKLRPNRQGQRRPWLVYVETISVLRGDAPNGSYTDSPDIGQLALSDAAFGPEPDGGATPKGRTAAAPPSDAPPTRRSGVPASAGLLQALPQALGEHKNYVVGGYVEDEQLPTSGVAFVAPAREHTSPEPESDVDPAEVAAIRAARHRRRRDGSLLSQPPLHGRSIGLVADQVVGWPVPPKGRELVRWRVEVSVLLHDGVPIPAITAGMQACAAKGFSPTALASFVYGEANRRTQTRGDQRIEAVAALQRDDGGPGLAAFVPNAFGAPPPRREIGTPE